MRSYWNYVQSLGLEHDGDSIKKKKSIYMCVCVCMAGSLCCTAEIEGTLQIN